jgi:oligopeptide transport system permease protein
VIGYLVKRFLGMLATLWVVATGLFFLLRAVPGGPFDTERRVPAEVEAQLNAAFKLDAPLSEQYSAWLGNIVFHGDFGPSFKYANRTVTEIIGGSFPVSIQLGLAAMVLALCIGIPLGIIGAIRQNTWADTAAMATAMLGISIPRFVLAPLLVLVFSLQLYWLPSARWETWAHMVLPVICAGLPPAAYIARLTRGGMLEVIRSDFIRTARAKGLPERTVILRHALKGGLLPVVSYLGPGTSGLLVGSLVIEKIFDIPGMGRYFVEAAVNRDYNLVMGVTLVYGTVLMLMNTVVDVAYAYLDPRVQLR